MFWYHQTYESCKKFQHYLPDWQQFLIYCITFMKNCEASLIHFLDFFVCTYSKWHFEKLGFVEFQSFLGALEIVKLGSFLMKYISFVNWNGLAFLTRTVTNSCWLHRKPLWERDNHTKQASSVTRAQVYEEFFA